MTMQSHDCCVVQARAFKRAVGVEPRNADACAQLAWSLLQANMVGAAADVVKGAAGAAGSADLWWPYIAGIQLHGGRADIVAAEFRERLAQPAIPGPGQADAGVLRCLHSSSRTTST
jgi:hypothetical protein